MDKVKKLKIAKKLNLSVTIVLVIAILAVINFISYKAFFRWDITESHDFSISKASKTTAGELDDVVNIKAYFSKNLPSQFLNLKQEVADILSEYQSYSQGKIKVEFIDPGNDEEMKNKLYLAGIPPLQLNVLEKDKYQVVQGYLGLAISYGDKTEAIPVVKSSDDLEYQITTAIKKVSGKESPVIGYLTSYGTIQPEEANTALAELKKIYEVQNIDLKAAGQIPKEIKTLIIAGPKEKFGDKELKAVDSYLSGGGSILLLIDGVNVGQGLTAEKNETGLEKLLEKYGIRANTDLIADPQSGVASFNQGYITFSVEYPFWPKILKGNFDKNVSAVSNLETVILPWVSSIDVIPDKMNKDNRVSNLIMSSEKSWRVAGDYNISPQGITMPKEGAGSYSLAVLASGSFTSAYDAKKTFNSKIAVVGDSDFIRENFAGNAPDNLALFQNLTDILSLDEALINIRSKGVTSRPVKELSEAGKAGIRYANVFGMTIIIVGLGALRYITRRRKRQVNKDFDSF